MGRGGRERGKGAPAGASGGAWDGNGSKWRSSRIMSARKRLVTIVKFLWGGLVARSLRRARPENAFRVERRFVLRENPFRFRFSRWKIASERV